MNILSLGLLMGSTIVLVLYCGSMLFHLFSLFFGARAPFVPSSRRMIGYLPKLIQPDAQSVIYDLGCGDGRILRSLYRRFSTAHYIGIDNDVLPYLLARLFNWNIPSSRLTIKRKNFFDEDISSATHVIMYLFPAVMAQLLPKLEKELQPGTTLISFDFSFSNKKPDRVIEAPELRHHKIYVYLF